VIAKNDEERDLRQRGDFLGRVPRWAAAGFHEHERFCSGRIEQGRGERKRSGLQAIFNNVRAGSVAEDQFAFERRNSRATARGGIRAQQRCLNDSRSALQAWPG
jgi:hypothetical protein